MNNLTVQQYVQKYYRDFSHAYEVKKLALMMFDEINTTLNPFSLKLRKLLETASILHDIGYNINSKNHNKHSFSIIYENGIRDFDDDETAIIAHVARYHRGGLPDKTRHKEFGLLKKKERKIVKKLAAILRICDGLDRAHMQLIKSLRAEFDEDNKIFTIFLTSNIPERTPDISAAIRKKDLFEKVYKVQVVFKFETY